MDTISTACKAILQEISSGEIDDARGLARAKLRACKEFGLSRPLKNSEILAVATTEERNNFLQLLRIKPVRSISGVSVITVMPKPHPCPTPEPCLYCPGGPSSGTPQSYTGREPAAARALEYNFEPYAQVRGRIEQLRAIGHDVDKVELIIFGGTISAYPHDYLRSFVTQCLNAVSGTNARTLDEAQAASEAAPIRISDIMLETRPDYCRVPHVDFMLELGTTRVELGVQTTYDDVYNLVKRGHTVEDVVEATRTARDAGLAVIYHMMPGLPGSDPKRDLEMFKVIFEDERFKPDAMKIYPTLVMPGTELYKHWQRGDYKPYSLEQMVELVMEVKSFVPPWVRIQRVQRDIPANLIAAGVKRGDLRVMVQERMREKGTRCRCVRCREVGHVQYKLRQNPNPDNIELVVERYRASEGEELFMSFEDVKQDILIGLLRLREPSPKAHRLEAKTVRSMLVRELHVYGPLVQVGKEARASEWQHRGWGEKLLREAERISSEEFDAKKVIVLAGIGARNYYRRFGYEREGPYMAKNLHSAS